MAGSSASKKVARAARTGGGRRRDLNANLGFYALLVALALIGALLVWFSRDQRLEAFSGGREPAAPYTDRNGQQVPGDNWFAAYGFYICDKFAPPIDTQTDNFGFGTRNDNVIWIHPFTREYSGSNANLGAFARSADFTLDRDSFKLPGEGQTEYIDGETKCGDQTGKLIAKVWEDAKKPENSEIREGDLSRIPLKDNQAITIAFVPENFDTAKIPIPPSAATLDQAAARYSQPDPAATPATPGEPGANAAVPGAPGAATPVAPSPADPAAPAPAAP